MLPISMQAPIYLDFNASTPIAPQVEAAMKPLLGTLFGNPSSRHWASAGAREVLDLARKQVASLLDAEPRSIVFTSGGSESNNSAIKGVYYAGGPGMHVITASIEHPATLKTCRFLERLGAELSVVGVDHLGRVDPESIERALRPNTRLVSLMHANNEVGTIQPIREVSALLRPRGVLLHVDAAQSAGKAPVSVDELGADLLSLAGHKLYAPKGVGALFVREGVRLEPLVHGGPHEAGRRAGTESLLLAVGLGVAAELARSALERSGQVRDLRDRLFGHLRSELGETVVLNGHPEERLCNTLNVSFLGQRGADILEAVPELAASTGSACHEGITRVSAVLEAMGIDEARALGAIRFSLGRTTTREEIDRAAALLVGAVQRNRGERS